MRAATAGKENLSVEDAVALIKANATAKFDETVEISMNLGVDPRHADQMVRGVVGLPNGTGKTVRVAVFARGPKAEEAEAAGADIVGAEDLMETIQGGKIEFDRCIATPDMMPVVGRLGKILGPRNLMPNPKIGTVTMDVAQAVQGRQGRAGAVQGRDVPAVMHGGDRQGVVRTRGEAGGQRARLRFCRAKGQAGRCQGHLCREDLADLHDGAGRIDRRWQRRDRVRICRRDFRSGGGWQGRKTALSCPRRRVRRETR